MLKEDKDKIIDEIMDLRTLVGRIENKENEDKVTDIQRQINKIHDMIFGL